MAMGRYGKEKSIILVMMLIVSSLFVVASVTEVSAASSGNFNYRYINGDSEVQITGYTGTGGQVFIPNVIDGKYVTSIGDDAFSYYATITFINIPTSVTNIGDNAFTSCTGLTYVTIPASVTTIGNYTFSYCSALISVTILGNLTTIGDSAFYFCTALNYMIIPSSVTSIGDNAFLECPSLMAIYVDSLNANYASLNGVLYDKSMTHLIQCPGGKAGAFVIPENVTTLGGWSFYDCSLTSVMIPRNVTSIGYYAFLLCSALTAINVNASNLNYASLNGVLYDKSMNILIQCPEAKAGAFVIPNNVTMIGDEAFMDCHLLTSITIPNTVIWIGQSAFYGCKSLTSVTIPFGVISIGNSAFSYCENVTHVTIPGSVTSIGGRAFLSCISLTSITVPENVTTIGTEAFFDCSRLTAIQVNSSNPNYASLNGVLYNKSMTQLIQCPGGKAGAFVIPSNVTAISDSAFTDCRSLTSITIPGSITSIANHMFSDCVSLTAVTIPANVTSIGNYAFYSCTRLASVTIPSSTTHIGFYAFSNCVALTSVTIPKNVTSIENYAFGDCTALTAINVNAGNANYSGVNGVLYDKNVTTLIQYPQGKAGAFTIPSSVTIVASSALANSPALTSVTVPSSVLTIESAAFAYCQSLKVINVSTSNPNYASLDGVLYDKTINTLVQFPSGIAGTFTIPSSVIKIGNSAFYLCDLTSVRIPASVSSIGNWSFGSCASLTRMQFDGNVPSTGYQWIYSFNTSLKIVFINGALGFTTPTWFGVQTVPLFHVTGTVVGTDGKGLANITVALEDGTSVKTNAIGNFSILASSGDHTLTISGPDIDTQKEAITLAGADLTIGSISAGRSSNDMTWILVLVLVLAIAIVLIVVFVMIRRRRLKTAAYQPPIAPGATSYAPAAGTPAQVQTIPQNCPDCGAETMDAPFCGNCGKKLK
jgi:hypothetical protein